MKRIYILLLLALMVLAPVGASAQSPQNRVPKTIVADVLAQMPAKNKTVYDKMMADLAGSGAEGINILTGMMSPTGDNTAVSYAIGGLCYWATAPEREAERAKVNTALIKALEATGDRELKAFYIRMLAITGDQAVIPVVVPYMTDAKFIPSLSTDAVQTVVEIGGAKAAAAIMAALETIPDKKTAAAAAGQLSLVQAEPILIGWLAGADAPLRKSIYYALSQLGGAQSIGVLAKAAKGVKYAFEETGVTGSYLALLGRTKAVVPAQSLIKSKDAALRSAAISLIASGGHNAVFPYVLKAMNDTDRAYRNTALAAAAPYADEQFVSQLTELLPKLKCDIARADIINWLGVQRKTAAFDAITPYFASTNNELRGAAINAIARLNTTNSMRVISQLFTSPDSTTVAQARAAIVWSKSEGVAINPLLIQTLPTASAPGRVAIIGLLAERRATEASKIIQNYTSASNGVGDAAIAALKDVVGASDLTSLCKMLEKASGANVVPLQQAVGAAMSAQIAGAAGNPRMKGMITRIIKDKEALYYPALVAVGNGDALKIVSEGLTAEDAAVRKAAAQALSQWSAPDAINQLYTVFVNPEFKDLHGQALESYIDMINAKGMNDTQKMIMLRKALDKASNAEQKNQLLDQIARLNSFNALMLAGGYLTQADTEQAAGTAIMNIVLRDKGYKFYGPEVKAMLGKFLEVRKGGDASYDKAAIEKYLAEAPEATAGFVAIFNGKDLAGWKGLVGNPIARAKMSAEQLAAAQVKADEIMGKGWEVRDGVLYFTGHGDNLCTDKKYGDFEMYVDWFIEPMGDAGIYLRGAPQVQIWDTTRRDVGADVGSGGLYNNGRNPSKPTVLADNAIGEWNTFYIKMVGERVTVHLNGIPVVENVIMENYWDRSIPIFAEEQLELQAHGTLVGYRDIYVKELPRVEPYKLSADEAAQGFKVLFDGVSMNEWIGNTRDYVAENGTITLYPGNGGGGNLYTKDEYKDFNFRFEFMLTPAANNGLGIRTPLEGDAAYVGMTELQILDNEHPVYKDLAPYQYHGSAYGMIPSKRGFLKPLGEWNTQEVIVKGSKIKVTLNGEVILDGDLAEATKNGTADKQAHPGLKNPKGHIAFLGHGSEVKFRNIRIKTL